MCDEWSNVLMQPLFAHLVRDEAQEDGGGDKGGTDYNLIQPMNQMRSRAAGQRQSGPCSSCIILSYRKSQLIAFLPRQAPASSSEGGNSTRESIHVFFKWLVLWTGAKESFYDPEGKSNAHIKVQINPRHLNLYGATAAAL
jgi:hypothetical protein